MTNYPAEFGRSPFEMTQVEFCQHLLVSLSLMTWNPRKWALQHKLAIDFPSAWWMAGHAIELQKSRRG